MVDEKQQQFEEQKAASNQQDALQGQLGNMLTGVERTLAVTCESIMDKMRQLENKIQDMEKRYTELAKDAENAIKEAELKEEEEEVRKAGGDADNS